MRNGAISSKQCRFRRQAVLIDYPQKHALILDMTSKNESAGHKGFAEQGAGFGCPAINRAKPAYLGFGLSLRSQQYSEILEQKQAIDWFEIISENYMVPGGTPLKMLDRIRAYYPVVMHGVSLSIAST